MFYDVAVKNQDFRGLEDLGSLRDYFLYFTKQAMKDIFQKIIECIQQGQSVALATVIARSGSIPASMQAKMLVFLDGSIVGTVGGGKLEAAVIQAAQQVVVTATPRIVEMTMTENQIATEGLICGGRAETLIEPFGPGTDLTFLEELVASYSGVQASMLATVVNTQLAPGYSRKVMIRADGTTVGRLGGETLTMQLVQAVQARGEGDKPSIMTLELAEQAARELGLWPDKELRVFLEPVRPLPTAYLFGGGHVALHLAQILHLIGFEFVVIDDRAEFANQARFPHAKACLVHSFANVFAELPANLLNAYLIIVTRGHACDVNVLEQAVRTNAKYIGMIGSRRKIAMIMQHLREQGVSQAILDTVHAPIGLKIGADTPEEIAVSIAAELIQIRRGQT